jgi:Spy/CpxP family protein refolding chaperone
MSRIWTRRGFWLGGGALAAAAAAFAVSPKVMAFHRGMGGFGGPRAFGHHFMGDPERAKEHVGAATEWVLKTVEGTNEQKAAARRIGERLVDDLAPLAERRKALRESFVRELGKPEVDKAELERLRLEGLKLADDASRAAVGAMGDFANVLSAEQRAELLDWAARFHGR